MKKIKIIEYKFEEGFESVANRLLELSKQDYIVKTVFNGVPLSAENASRATDILEQKYAFKKTNDEYINSVQYALDEAIFKKIELE